ncbi:AAA family ATPase [Streptomyces sp. NPDC059740]|uniref:helix-turn-helix transcriptional regulator n=1 Tax=Streptomyces sp. NPDC059740 TaxID=3346926 RepID=UPI003651211F
MIVNLIGREAEFGHIESALQECRTGTRSLFLVEGGAGCGKSTFLDAVWEKARSYEFTSVCLNGRRHGTETRLDLVRQLAGTPGLPEQAQHRLTRDMRRWETGTEQGDPVPTVVPVLRQVTEQRPLLLAVDDVDELDEASLDVLVSTVHHTRYLPIVYVLTSSLMGTRATDGLGGRLLHIPWLQRLRLRPWGVSEVYRALRHGGNLPPLAAQAPDIHAPSGGNPLLVRAVAEEQKQAEPDAGAVPGSPRPDAADQLRLGGPFSQALLSCLERSSHLERAAATAVAVLGHGSPQDVATVLNVATTTATQALHALEATGIIEDGRFLHPVAAAAVLDTAPRGRRQDLHRRAAGLLHGRNAEAPVVARHLVASGTAGQDWQLAVLEAAARQALEDDDVWQADGLLRFALDTAEDAASLARIRARLALITWRCSPTVAEKDLTVAVDAVRAGLLPPADREALLGPILLGGRVDDALEIGGVHEEHRRPAIGVRSHAAVLWAAHTRTCRTPGGTDAARPQPLVEPGLLVTTPVWASPDRQQGDAARRLLESTPLTDGLLAPLINTVKVLALAGPVDEAEEWCNRLLDQAGDRDAPGWRAVLLTLRAELALLRGRLPLAERLAGEVAEILPSGGVFATGARAVRILARTAMGRHSEAAQLLDQPYPDGLFDTLYGLGLLRARGRHYLATGSHHEALDDFRTLGLLAGAWGIDRPGLLPWRLDAVQAHLLLGEREPAEALLEEQMADPSCSVRTRGIALRLQAELAKAAQRPRLLTAAIEQLHLSGDRRELGLAYDCLATAFGHLGMRPRATAMRRTASELARECGDVSPTRAVPDGRAGERRPAEARTGLAPGGLSTSEHRVAVLAARGLTNREISRSLFITVSTVEQHLTRAYRKLGVSRRQELALALPERA